MNEEKIPTLDDFENKYTMTDKLSTCWHHDPSTKGWFDTAGEELETVYAQMKEDPKKVWTSLTSGLIINGFWRCDRDYYIITNEAGEDGEFYQ